MKTLRIRCSCGRNLADVHHEPGNPLWTRDSLVISPRPNVAQTVYRPSHEARRGGPTSRAAADRYLTGVVDWDLYDRTYTWKCRCGRTWQLNHESVSELWRRYERDAPVVSLVVHLLT